MPSTVKSSCRRVISLAFGANMWAYLTTCSGKVAEKRTTCKFGGSMLVKVRIKALIQIVAILTL